jgi:transcription initiation factor TFIIIB Brf1 subunit/transcription initiation factor TFIIB
LIFFFGFQLIHQEMQSVIDWDKYLIEERAIKYNSACNGCGKEIEEFSYDEYVSCPSCGRIKDRIIDSMAEYRFFQQEDRGADPSRVGAPHDPRLPESSLGTFILGGGGKAMYNIRKYHSWNMLPYRERSMLQIYERLNIIATNNGLSNKIIESTKGLYQQMIDVCDRRGLNRDCILASSLYTSLKQNGSPRKPKEVSDMFNLTSASFTRALKNFQEAMMLADQKGILGSEDKDVVQMNSTKARDYIGLPLSRLGISRELESQIKYKGEMMCDYAEDNCISSENMPTSLAAGMLAWILKCNGIEMTNSQIASACEVSVATLQKCLRRLNQWNDELKAQYDKIKM